MSRHTRNEATNHPICGAKGPMGEPSDCPDCDEAMRVPAELRPWAYGDEPEPLETSDTEDTETEDGHV